MIFYCGSVVFIVFLARETGRYLGYKWLVIGRTRRIIVVVGL